MPGIVGPLPMPLPTWMKAVIRALPWVAVGVEELVDYLNEPASVEALGWRRITCEWQRLAPTGLQEDRAMCTFDVVNITSGEPDDTWDAGDYTTVDNLLNNFWTVVMGYVPNHSTMVAYHYYHRRFNPTEMAQRFEDTGPPVHTTVRNVVGGISSGQVPYQLATSLTEITAFAGHWGRAYLPAPAMSGGAYGALGRFGSAYQDAIVTAAASLYTGLTAADFLPVVPMTQYKGQRVTALATPIKVQVDDIADVVRRRRPKHPYYRDVRPV